MAATDRYPPQIKFIVGNEACERFSYYGMASILVLYMNEHLRFSEQDSKGLYHLFVMAVYLAPLAGGFFADRFAGRYRTILWISFAYVLGHAVLATWETRGGLLAGLALIAVGAGGIKPSVSAFVGDQFPPEARRLRERLYGWFYWTINFGSGFAKLLIPLLLVTLGPKVAFAVPGVLMALALVVFWSGRRHYVVTPPSGPNPHAFTRVVARAVQRLGTGKPGQHWLDGAADRHPEEAIEGAKVVFRLLGVFAGVTLFWALFDQKGSSWVFQAKRMGLATPWGELNPAQLQALNPFLVMLLIPLFTWGVFPLLARLGVELPPLRKMTAGMFITVLSFAAAALVQLRIDAGTPPHALWQIPQYVLLTIGEVLVSVTGLEFSYSQAPKAMRGTIMSFWLLTVFLGNFITAGLTELVKLEGAAYFWLFTGLMLVAAILFREVARRYRPVSEQPVGTPAPALR
jgi:POT family proton-dependent oligopeptide transporter